MDLVFIHGPAAAGKLTVARELSRMTGFRLLKLRELTLHHKDHNHDNNPPDGSNWELLCLYCHDNEHARHLVADASDEPSPGGEQVPPSTYRPFADLEDLLKRKT